MEKSESSSEKDYKAQPGKTGSSLRDFRFRVPPKPSHSIQYGILKPISDRVLATTSESIRTTDELDGDPQKGANLVSLQQGLEATEDEDLCIEMKTLCIDKKSVKMPSTDEHNFLNFCGLGLKTWQCPLDYNQADFRSAILSVYPRMASVVGFTVWILTENRKILERIPDEKTAAKDLVECLSMHCTDILIIVPSTNIFLMEEKRGYLSKIDSEKNAPTTTTDSRFYCLVCGTSENPGYASDFYRTKTDQMAQWNKKQTIEEKLEEILGIDLDEQLGLSDRMCPKCFKYISWIDKKEDQLKRSRSLLSNAFRATNSKLSRSHPSVESKSGKSCRLPEPLNLSHIPVRKICRPNSPDQDSGQSQLQFAHRNHIVQSSPFHSLNSSRIPNLSSSSMPSLNLKTSPSSMPFLNSKYSASAMPFLNPKMSSSTMPFLNPKPSSSTMPSLCPKPSSTPVSSSTFISTFPASFSSISTSTNSMNNSHNYTSGYESSYSQSDINKASPELTRRNNIYDSQGDSCFESDSNYQPSELNLLRGPDSSFLVNFNEKDERGPKLGIKRRQHPDLCWEVINSQDLSSSKNLGPLKKRQLSYERGSPPIELERASQITKKELILPKHLDLAEHFTQRQWNNDPSE